MNVFISHNVRDHDEGRRLGAQLKLVGADVWFDEWEIRAGDSIVGRVEDALQAFDTFVLLWSESAAGSPWVRSELETAIVRRLENGDLRIVPVRVDDEQLPPLLRPLKYVTLDEGVARAVDEIMGFSTDGDRIRAIQTVLDGAGIAVRYFHGYGPMVGCPKCGSAADALEGTYVTDPVRGDAYAGARCRQCSWQGGGEV